MAERNQCHLWFIPACAGDTRIAHLILLGITVHPRAHEGYASSDELISRAPGSSPHARGIQKQPSALICSSGSSTHTRGETQDSRKLVAPARLIPACAGDTTGNAFALRSPGVHPRACAGDTRLTGWLCLVRTVHPRVRGGYRVARIYVAVPKVHPRSHGGYYGQVQGLAYPHGSSPRARGTHSHCPEGHQFPGFIPACTGETNE